MRRLFAAFVVSGLSALLSPCTAQNGDHAGEAQIDVVPRDKIPPAPRLSPEQELTTFKLADGFRAELVASEPLIDSPVTMQFDERGRLWVVEMIGFMPDADGRDEERANGRVVILEDTDGDGRMDKRTVFLDHLVMPRAVMLFRNGALIAEPPNVWFAADADGDGRCDSKTLLFRDYASPDDPKYGYRANPEHASNGLFWALDNWVYSANHTFRYRWRGGTATNWVAAPTIFRGQWGISQDDEGRLYHNSNSDQLRADEIPAEYLLRNPDLRQPYGANVQLTPDQRVWPSRVNPGVNRGYQPGQLAPDGRLATYTAACGPVVYRGDQFGADAAGDVFLCEPSANMIRRDHILDRGGELTATNAYDHAEFFTSTDERFRPVNLFNGPDGALYVVDMYRGIIQHHIYLTTYLRKQAESRGLDKPTGDGRIWRVVRDGRPARRDKLDANPSLGGLLAWLKDSNGWRRDRAQQLIIERQNAGDGPALRRFFARDSAESALGRLQALWTLEGLDALDLPTIQAGLDDADTRVRNAALRLAEKLFDGEEGDAAREAVLAHAGRLAPGEQLQWLLTLGSVRNAKSDALLRDALSKGPPGRLELHAAVSGLAGRELEFLEAAAKGTIGPAAAPLCQLLAACVITEGKPDRVEQLLEFAVLQRAGGAVRSGILEGAASLVPIARPGKPAPRVEKVRLGSEPAALARLRDGADEKAAGWVDRITQELRWPGKPGEAPEPPVVPLTAEQRASFERGRDLYPTICGACHQPHGNGQDGLAPPLRESEWVLGSDERVVRIALKGVRDEITVRGAKYTLNMPGLSEALNDGQIADLLTYIRREWGHAASPIDAATVRRIRGAVAGHEDSWTEAELVKFP
jgi:mono/diheme cytochrome c family protein/glucose/arabinose dehydrogenase